MSFADFGLAQPSLRRSRRRLHDPHTHSVAGNSVGDGGPRRARLCPNGHGQNSGLRFANPTSAIRGRAGREGPRPTDSRLVLSPTRELAAQIGDGFRAYGRHTGLRHTVVFGGVNQRPQVRDLQHGVDTLIATPGRLLDLMNQGFIDLGAVKILVLDEADRMLDMGFLPDLRRIVAKVPRNRQTLLFSATMPAAIAQLAGSILRNPVEVRIAPARPPATKSKIGLLCRPRAEATLLKASQRAARHAGAGVHANQARRRPGRSKTGSKAGIRPPRSTVTKPNRRGSAHCTALSQQPKGGRCLWPPT